MEKIVILKSVLEKVTEQNRFQLPQESFRLSSVEVSFDINSLHVTFCSMDGWGSIWILDRGLNKSVTLDFFDENEISVSVHFWKGKRNLMFWKKRSLQIKKSISCRLLENNKDDENVKFIWDRIPEYLINLK